MRDGDQLLSIREAAAAIGVTTKTLQRWESQGTVPRALRTLGGHRRFPRDMVQALADARTSRYAVWSRSWREWVRPDLSGVEQLDESVFWEGRQAADDATALHGKAPDGGPALLVIPIPERVWVMPPHERAAAVNGIIQLEAIHQVRQIREGGKP